MAKKIELDRLDLDVDDLLDLEDIKSELSEEADSSSSDISEFFFVRQIHHPDRVVDLLHRVN